MSDKPSRFAGIARLPADPALEALGTLDTLRSTDPSPARTWPGRIAEQQSRGLEGRALAAEGKLKTLEASGQILLHLDPRTIRRSLQANRHPLSLQVTDDAFAELKSSLKRDGQILPVVVHRIADDPDHGYELVSGHRRHEAALQLNLEVEGGFKLFAVIDAAAHDPARLALHMYLENAARKDLSAHEMGSMFSRWIRDGIYGSQGEIAKAVGKDRSTIRQYIDIAELPDEIIAAFRDPRTIAVYWNKALTSACRDRRQQTLARAAKLAKQAPPPSAEFVYKTLTAEPVDKSSKSRATKLQETVKVNDKPLFRIAMRGSKWTIDSAQVPSEKRAEFYEQLKAYAHKYIESQLETRK